MKFKKPVDFGFLDFSTAEKRAQACGREVELNRRFSPTSTWVSATMSTRTHISSTHCSGTPRVQKSLVEGFGLTVTEPMWKAKAVVASRVGGIQDQIVHGESGLLLDDPSDLDAFGSLVQSVLNTSGLAERLGAGARERVRQQYLGDRHLVQYVALFERLLSR